MGDGGVACMSLQQQQHLMETFPVPTDKSLCGVKSNGNGFSSKSSTKLGGAERKKKMKVKKEKLAVKNIELNRGHVAGLSKNAKSNLEDDNVENGEVNVQKEEVEEGELGTLKWPRGEVENGEFLPEKSRRSEIEKGEVVGEKWRKGIEKGDFFSSKRRSGEREKSEILITPEKSRKGDSDKGDSGSWRTAKDENEIEKGEFIPDRWQKGEMMRDDYSYAKTRRYELGKEKGRKYDNDRILPAGINLADDFSWRKELSRSGSQNSKSTSRWESFQERDSRISSKIVDQDNNKNDYINKNEYNNDKNNGREYLSSNRLKRYDTDSDSIERKHFGDYGGLKSRRLTDDGIRPAHPDHQSRISMERSYRVSSSSRVSLSSRHYDSPLSSRLSYERHGRSPGHSERSPRDRARYHNYRDRSPVHRDRSPVHRDRSPYNRERSPFSREKSPYDRSRHYDHRPRSPSYVERSPQDRVRYSERRDRTSSYLDRSPFDYNRSNSHRETAKKSGTSEKFNAQFGNKVQEDKSHQKDPRGRDSSSLAKEAQEKSSIYNGNESVDTNGSHGSFKEESQTPIVLTVNCKEFSHVYGACEEPPSMEEDMDICDTPPHVPLATDSSTGKWFYVDYYGVECGPSKLCDLKVLVEEGALVSDHLIKHFDCDRWFTVENAVSPVVAINFSSIVSDSITQLVSPPEAPGNVLVDTAVTLQDCETAQFGIGNSEGQSVTLEAPNLYPDNCEALSESLEDLHIDERVGALLQGVTIILGRELESVGEALQMTFDMNAQGDALDNSEDMVSGFSLDQALFGHQFDQKTDILPKYSDIKLKDGEESKLSVMSGQNCGVTCVDSDDWFLGRWSCKGGDWKRNDEAAQDRPSRKKLVLNHGFPLCQISNAGYEDPRHHEDDLYCPLQSNKLDLPPWGFSCPDEKNDSGAVSRSVQSKPALNRGVKGTMLPVVRINACVVKDHDSLVSELRVKVKAKDRYSSRLRPHSITGDGKRSSVERDSQSKATGSQGSNGHRKSMASINVPKDRVCTADDLQLPLGEWYYLDGAGHERGPLSIADLHLLVDEGLVPRQSSIFRKSDQLWVPVMSAFESYQLETTVKSQQEKSSACSEISPCTLLRFNVFDPEECNSNPTSFHNRHPQFIGYTRGKLHEFVMKSYKSREFAAAVNVVLETWINVRQPKKEMEKHTHWKSEIDARVTKRARILPGEFEEDYEMEVDLNADQKDQCTFEDLYGEATFNTEDNTYSESATGSWGLLNGQALARVFHFLRSDLKSLAFAAITCKHWRTAVRFYKGISRQVDFSSLGASCSDYQVLNIMSGYNKEKVDSMVLLGCTNISSPVLEEILASFPLLSSVDVRGCTKLGELVCKYTNVNWIQKRSSFGSKSFEDGHCKMRSLMQISDKYSSLSKAKGLNCDSDEFGELNEYFESVDKRDSANQLFRRSLYKRSKLFDARRSSSILSRDARMRQWAIKKSEIGYKRMQEFLASSLKSIMKENTYDFFVPKVQEIQDRLKKGYYIGHGLSSVKEDISRMCRDAIKAKNRGDTGDMNPILTSFIQLASRLEGSFKLSIEKEVKLKSLEDDSTQVFASATASKYRKKLSKMSKERKYKNRSSAATFANGGLDHGEYASDREIKQRLSRLNKKTMESGSDTSDDFERSSGKSESESSVSDTESDLDVRSEGRTGESRGDEYFTLNERFDVTTDDREWGARMTKASLVPPVTRKYEVIDQYVIVADEEDVQQKMRVSLPDDYNEKLKAQKNGTEELDMELPEVKDYKPRKQLGDEVLEQEVYGIDPYTHNLVLDSIPDGLDWPLQDKHLFIEDVLLRTLNKLVRNFTGTGNTPMMYHLQPVIEEIERNAEAWDRQTIRICQGILNAIEKRPDDKYVAYRKGLGVVCNREGGFSTDDFIVEFLGEVYPVWKWFEKQDGIRSLQKNNKDPAPEFYNIYLERPKGDADGYDLVVVDAMHKANYASRICHSCRPNCEAKVTAVDGHYQIGIYAVRDIQYGEEITFDYNSVTESKEEYEASVCLCGSQVCRGSYLNLTGEGAFQKVLEEWHGILDRHHLMVEACEVNSVTEEDYLDLGRAGLGSCLLGGLPDWVVAYSARLVRFINFERTKLPEEILKHNLEEKRKYFSDICLELEKSDAEVQAEGVYNQRLQNLAVTLDKVRYVMRCIFGDPKNAPPPLEKLSPEDTVSFLWKGDGSLVEELLQSMVPHVEEDLLNELRSKVHACDPMESDDVPNELQRSLLWLRDEVRNLPCTYKSRHDAAADLIHIYAYTKCFFRIQKYKAITSPPVYISPLDLGPNYADKLGSGFQEYCKTYGENYCLGQLIFWYNQTNAEPDCSLARASKGCLSLPDIGSFYAKVQKPSKHRVYGPKTVRFMLARMEKQPQRSWPKDRIWCFKSTQNVLGSPMMDAILYNTTLDKEMVRWLKSRPAIFQAMWDQ